MMPTRSENELCRWTVPGHALTVDYSPPVLEAIRVAVVEGFYKIARGGIEVGGVLFGDTDLRVVRILAARPLPCEYASGPTFVLSGKDREALRALLKGSAGDPELDALYPVGWYLSHTRSDIHLSDGDLDIYDRFFPEPWQVSLVLKVEKMKPVRAGFFFREQDGSVQVHSSYQEFTVEPLGRKGGPALRQVMAKTRSPSPHVAEIPAVANPEPPPEERAPELPLPAPEAVKPPPPGPQAPSSLVHVARPPGSTLGGHFVVWRSNHLAHKYISKLFRHVGQRAHLRDWQLFGAAMCLVLVLLAAAYFFPSVFKSPRADQPPSETLELQKQKDALGRQVEQLQIELEKQSARNDELQRKLDQRELEELQARQRTRTSRRRK